MAYLEIGGQRQAIPVGEMVVGSDPTAHVVLAGEGVAPRHAILVGLPDGQASIRLVSESAEVLVNGVRLGAQPVPLLHGDKVEIAGQELLFVDERRSGSTQYVEAVDPSMLAAAAKPGARRTPTSGTGGRLVSLTDGREYAVAGPSLLIGRDAGCDVVITSKNISRRHAEVVATPKGYLLVDSSTNGTFVNGQRVAGQQLLARSDVIRCGDHEFRFYADVAPSDPTPPPRSEPPAARPSVAPAEPPAAPPSPVSHEPPAARPSAAPAEPPAVPPSPAPPESPATPKSPAPPEPPPGAEHRLSHTLHGVPAVPRPAGSPKGRPAPPYRPPQPPQAPRKPEPTPERAPSPPASARGPVEPSVMANLVVRSGPLKGKRFPIRVPIVNVGRAEYNDIVLGDPSVSTTHAKLQRREGIWILIDMDSTNGTLVDGERAEGEVPLAPGALVRFGEVQTIFEPTDDTIDLQKGSSTRLIDAVRLPDPPDRSSRENS